MYAMINPYVVFWPVLCAYWWWGQSLGGASKFSFRAFSSRRSSLTQPFCWKLCRLWSCPFIRTHDSGIPIQEIPTLTLQFFHLFS